MARRRLRQAGACPSTVESGDLRQPARRDDSGSEGYLTVQMMSGRLAWFRSHRRISCIIVLIVVTTATHLLLHDCIAQRDSPTVCGAKVRWLLVKQHETHFSAIY
jgi:hypothetical protein